MPILALYLSLKQVPAIGFAITDYQKYIYFVLIFSAVILPLISIFFLIKSGKVSSLEMNNHKERSIPLFRTALWMGIGYYTLENILVFSPIIKAELIGAISIILIASIISKYWKISLHLLGIGGVVGVLIGLEIIYGNLQHLIIIFIFLSGVLAMARIKEKAHNYPQVYIGFLVGLSVELLIILLF
ncbi:hypothetical protein N8838_01060 [Flavobacteriales bacterium]|nr:hypothetical protein [Flavobacteriales bacterium]|tara:strand:- start:1275 stop:1832 length:558 start_codon:yes stop_codon:yes gene_type:complete